MYNETLYNSICNLVEEAFKPEFGGKNIVYLQKVLSVGIIDEAIPKEYKEIFKGVYELLGGNIEISNINFLERTICAHHDQRAKVYDMISTLLYDVGSDPSLAEITEQNGIYELKFNDEILSVKKGRTPEVEYTNDIPLEDVLM